MPLRSDYSVSSNPCDNLESSEDLSLAICDGSWLQSHDPSCDVDFTKIDHKLKLYLVMHVLDDEDDEIQFAVGVSFYIYNDLFTCRNEFVSNTVKD